MVFVTRNSQLTPDKLIRLGIILIGYGVIIRMLILANYLAKYKPVIRNVLGGVCDVRAQRYDDAERKMNDAKEVINVLKRNGIIHLEGLSKMLEESMKLVRTVRIDPGNSQVLAGSCEELIHFIENVTERNTSYITLFIKQAMLAGLWSIINVTCFIACLRLIGITKGVMF